MDNLQNSRRTFIKTSLLLASGMTTATIFSNRSNPEACEKPNIIWLIADDVGSKEIGCYGHPTIRTPNIDRMAGEGIRFTQAFVTTSSCSPSRASMFTGKYPHSTGAEDLHDPLPAEQAILPELLAPAGYYSGNVGKYHLGKFAEKKFDRLLPKVEDWKLFLNERPQNRPFFLSLGFYDAHRTFDRGCIDPPYTHDEVIVPPYLPDIEEAREELAGFYDEITRMDGVIGEMMQYLETEGIARNTLVVFFGDNGMPFPRAKTTLYDSGIETPLIACWPEQINAGQVYEGLASLVDLAPTMLHAAGLPIPDDMQGRSLIDQVREPNLHDRDYIFAEKNWHDLDDHSRAVRDGRFKYIRNAFPEKPLENSADSSVAPLFQQMRKMRDAGTLTREQALLFRARRAKEELFDLAYDPMEFHNVAYESAYQGVLERMRNALDEWIEATNDISPSKSLPDEFHAETGERIRPPHQNQ
ncbi:MAG: heparan N-sulfatase [Candidatus Omnitrophota bacterium]|jgi:arylsulfatase A-like enzyme|nr:MAG: heparan N-sulfatase [Candidatus Omnitrophota bacterium]